MDAVDLKALHCIDVRNKKGQLDKAVLELRYHRIRVLPPIGKKNRYPELQLTVIYARERGTPKERDRIDWKLITDLPVSSPLQAIEKLEWYASRWKIETFHKILKSGCKAETSKLRTAERLVNLIAVFSYSQLAGLLDDHAESFNPESANIHCFHGYRMSIVGSARPR